MHSNGEPISLGQRLANWAQVGTFIVIAWGYLFTVRPVYQKEKLAEDVARMERELRTAEEARDVALRKADLATGQHSALLSSIDALSNQLHIRQADAALLEAKKQGLEEELGAISTNLLTAKGDLESTRRLAELNQRRVIASRFSFMSLGETGKSFRARETPFELESNLDVVEALRSTWESIQPDYASVIEELSKADAQSAGLDPAFFASEIARYRDNLSRIGDLGQCKQPNFLEWRDRWQAAAEPIRSKTASEYLSCVDSETRRIAEHNGWSTRALEKVKQSDWWPEYSGRYFASCLIGLESRTELKFSLAWNDAESACSKHASAVFRQITSGAQDWAPTNDWSAIEPPSLGEP